MTRLLQQWLRYLAFERGKAVGWYLRVCRPDGTEWAAYLKRRDILYAMGDHCSVQTNVTFTDPKYVRLGTNVRLSGCILFGHDGSVNMLNRAYGVRLDRVGKIDLKDNVFIGHAAIVMPGVTVGPNALVAAGSVVNRDVPPNTVVAGVPARPVGPLDAYVERLVAKTQALPWYPILQRRRGDYDPVLQVELDRVRIAHFFGKD